MRDLAATALDATRRIRRSPGYGALAPAERRQLDHDLRAIESALGDEGPADPFARSLADDAPSKPAPPPPAPPPPGPVATLGARSAEVVQAVNFPGFVAGLIQGVFQAIVDATAQQVREYANLVASLSRSVDAFSRDNVTDDQARDWLAQKHPQDLHVALPEPGRPGSPQVAPRRGRDGQSPAWLGEYGLDGEALNTELTEGPLLQRARTRVGEERMQSLAAMVLMGINRVVVNEGDIRAKMQFHAVAREQSGAEMASGSAGQAPGIAGRGLQPGASMMVSTMKANTQADASIKADLMGEVRVTFRTETFPLERFADSAAIQLLNRHAQWRDAAPAAAPAPSPAPAPAAPRKEA